MIRVSLFLRYKRNSLLISELRFLFWHTLARLPERLTS
jgi:hypothetical protein